MQGVQGAQGAAGADGATGMQGPPGIDGNTLPEADPIFAASAAAQFVSGDKSKLDSALQPTGDGSGLSGVIHTETTPGLASVLLANNNGGGQPMNNVSALVDPNGANALQVFNRLLIATDAVSVVADFSSSLGLFYPPGNSFYATQQWVANQGFINHETDPVVGAVNGLVKADGAGHISAASYMDYQTPLTPGTDYLTPTGNGSGLTGITFTVPHQTALYDQADQLVATGDSGALLVSKSLVNQPNGFPVVDVAHLKLIGADTMDALNWSTRQLLGGNSGMTVAAVWADGVLRNASGNAFVALEGNDLHIGNWRIQPQGLVQHEISTVPDNAVDLANGVLAVYNMGGFQTVASWATGTLKDGAGNAFSTGAYSPANPGYWAGTPPSTLAEMGDRLAAMLSNSGANPIP